MPIIVNANTLTRVFNGISIMGLKGKNSVDSGNIIQLKTHRINGVLQTQNAIAYGGNNATDSNKAATSLGQIIRDNMITGSCNACRQTGMYFINQTNTHIACNSVSNLADGIKFKGKNIATRFFDNSMLQSNQRGFTLDNAIIGQQGDAVKSLKGVKYCTSNNMWDGDSTSWVNQGHYRIACLNGADATKSPLLVVDGNTYNPQGGCLVLVNSTQYDISNNSIQVINPLLLSTNCWRLCNQNAMPVIEEQAAEFDITTLEDIAQQDETLAATQDEKDAIATAKEQLYILLKSNPKIAEFSNILEDFVVQNQYAAIDYSSMMEYALQANRYDLAAALLDTWQTETQPDMNNLAYYTWLYNIQTQAEYKPNIEEVLNIAIQCPLTGGNVVFAARNLYNSLAEENINFEDECEGVAPTSRKAPNKQIAQVSNKPLNINVYPNPTQGYLFVNLPNINKPCWQITITNVYGKVVANKNIRNNVAKTFIELKGNKGIYFVKVYECNSGTQKIEKIILE